MRPFIPIALLCLLLASCHNNESIFSKYFNPGNLPEQTFTINTDKDTTLVTTQGIKITVPANAIETSGRTVTLIVKEALNIEDILKAGLTTTTGKNALTSDGMFYIGAKEDAAIKKPLHISLPTNAADGKMKLYKGIDKDGKIDWQSPTTMDKPATNVTDSGEALYKSNCTSCHAIESIVVGPALAWETKHRPMDWIREFTLHTDKLLAAYDAYSCCIYNKYKSSMTDFSTILDVKQVHAIYRYIDKVSKEKGIPENAAFNSCDSCAYYKNYYADLIRKQLDSINNSITRISKEKVINDSAATNLEDSPENYIGVLTKKRDALVKDNGLMANTTVTAPADSDPNADNGIIPLKVDLEKFDAEYYQFNITALGWYNIDDLLGGRFNSVKSRLTVSLENAGTERMEVYIVLPTYKVFNQGGLLSNDTQYGFYEDNGQIFLPQGANAFVFAIGEEKGNIYFGQTSFVTKKEQALTIKINYS